MERSKKTNHVVAGLLVGLKLLLICAIVAGVVSFVYELTDATYQQNLEKTKNLAVEELYGKAGLESITVPSSEDVRIYKVLEDDTLIGYCVEVTSKGFGGDVEMMVGFDRSRAVLGVKIISHSETPGLGSKMEDAAFLSQYVGISGQPVLGQDVDAISGASYSSRAVNDGVCFASEALQRALN